jgi:hypothetical protein
MMPWVSLARMPATLLSYRDVSFVLIGAPSPYGALLQQHADRALHNETMVSCTAESK